jgi:hypothetical protein
MKTIIFLIAVFAALAGCAVMVPGHLYPVQGPLSKLSMPPIYAVSMNGSFLPFGSLKVHLAQGITCSGAWKAVSQQDPSAKQMSAEWDEVYGSGYFVANVLGKRTLGRSSPTCTDSGKLSLEFLVVHPGDPSSTIGVASGGVGNVFKLTFGSSREPLFWLRQTPCHLPNSEARSPASETVTLSGVRT